ncbi:uncharacterized protein N0V89_007323 [Didymosphaeria variabile]|uniref:DUF1793-domain-containing protein n=1 Tax=Didymosphaeria variabile TaxID=1932322 RepID=A0A9W8XKV3_9PLEO|nr:uncharacterized protein N0V89_007323 [Didymosphaeria variabile]KAJ4351978.1 hypothetical protein N0V89_007323 [Didymosphaeria variabile]
MRAAIALGRLAALSAVSATASANRNDNGTDHAAKQLLQESMNWMDMYYDTEAGYLYNLDSKALLHDTRSSAWYSAGLLARNEGDDVEQASKIVENIIAGQHRNVSSQWYGDYQIYPEEPTVGTPQYPPVIYNSWDPNWRGFVGTTFILMLEEFPDLIPHDTQLRILESLHNATVGDSYRVGGVDSDNLYPSYSNPAIMRAFMSGWVGRRLNDSNMTTAGEAYAKDIVTLFDRADTLSEFNSGTYAGVSLYALTLWAKYLPQSSLMGQHGSIMIEKTWEKLGQLYNANLKNVAGPWDRSYGYDMNRYLSILALQIWTLVGKVEAPINAKPYTMGHKNDFAIGPLVAILAPFHNTLVPNNTLSALHTFPGTHTVSTSAFSPPWDTYPRNITAWISQNLTIGAESFSEKVIGGPAKNPSSFNPAVVQWSRKDGSVGWLTLYAQVEELQAVAGDSTLELEYPKGNKSSTFTFLVGTNSKTGKRDVASWSDVEGVQIGVNGTVDPMYSVAFAGYVGGAGETINDFEFWNFTYGMPVGSGETPRVKLSFNLQ